MLSSHILKFPYPFTKMKHICKNMKKYGTFQAAFWVNWVWKSCCTHAIFVAWAVGLMVLSRPDVMFVMPLNSLRPRPNRQHLAGDIFKCFFENENVWISIKISLKFVPKGSIYNNPALVQIMAWRRPGDKPLSEPMMVSLLTHICVTRPQWVNIAVSASFLMCVPILFATMYRPSLYFSCSGNDCFYKSLKTPHWAILIHNPCVSLSPYIFCDVTHWFGRPNIWVENNMHIWSDALK